MESRVNSAQQYSGEQARRAGAGGTGFNISRVLQGEWRSHPGWGWSVLGASVLLLPVSLLWMLSLALRDSAANFSSAYLMQQWAGMAPGGAALQSWLISPGGGALLFWLTAGLTGLAVFSMLVRYGWSSLFGLGLVGAVTWNWLLARGGVVDPWDVVRRSPEGWTAPDTALIAAGIAGLIGLIAAGYRHWRNEKNVNYMLPAAGIALFLGAGLTAVYTAPELLAIPDTWTSLYLLAGANALPASMLALTGLVSVGLFHEGFHSSSSRGLATGGVLSALLLIGIAGYAGASIPQTSGGEYPGFADDGSELRTVTTSFTSPDHFRIRPESVFPAEPAEVRSATHRLREMEPTTLRSDLPNFVRLKQSFGSGRLDYLTEARRARPESDTAIFGLVQGAVFAQVPLTDDQVDRWLDQVESLPTPLAEELGLLTNLVGSARKQRALRLVEHIESNLARTPENVRAPYGEESAFSRRGLKNKLPVLKRAAEELPGSGSDAQRRLRVVVRDTEGNPVSGVRVGLFQSFAPRQKTSRDRVRDEPDEYIAGERIPDTASAHYRETGSDGGAVFSGLRPAGYGVTALNRVSGESLPGHLYVSQSELPGRLPAGTTTVELRAVPVGGYRLTPGGQSAGRDPAQLTTEPAAEGSVTVVSFTRTSSGFDPYQIDASAPSQAALSRLLNRHGSDRFALVKRSESGAIERVWLPESFAERMSDR